MTFDATAYKQTTTDQWQEAAEAWHRWGPTLESWLGEATETMLDAARIGHGDRVLDVAAGAGGQSLAAARRVGPAGSVLATDIAPKILEFAELQARVEGLENVSTQVLDGESLEVEPASFDAAISRVGFIYFPDQQAAMEGMLRALKPGGRLAGIVYSTPQRNGFFSIPVSVIRERADLPSPAAGQPGPFSLGADGVLAAAFEAGGFVDVEVHTIEAPLRLGSAAECVRFERESFGALHQMLSGLSEAERAEAWEEIHEKLRQFELRGGFEGPCELLVGSGRRPGECAS